MCLQRCDYRVSYAFIIFENIEDAKAACISMHGKRINDREITVEYMLSKPLASGRHFEDRRGHKKYESSRDSHRSDAYSTGKREERVDDSPNERRSRSSYYRSRSRSVDRRSSERRFGRSFHDRSRSPSYGERDRRDRTAQHFERAPTFVRKLPGPRKSHRFRSRSRSPFR